MVNKCIDMKEELEKLLFDKVKFPPLDKILSVVSIKPQCFTHPAIANLYLLNKLGTTGSVKDKHLFTDEEKQRTC